MPLTASLLPVHNINKSALFVACACALTRSCPSPAGPYHAPTAGLSRGQVARLIAEENTRRLLRVGHATLKCAWPKHVRLFAPKPSSAQGHETTFGPLVARHGAPS